MTSPAPRRTTVNTKIGKQTPWGAIAGSLALVLFLGGIIGYAALNVGSGAAPVRELLATPDIDGVEPFVEDLSRDHTDGETDPVAFDNYPPTGGKHNPTWQQCKVYDDPIRAGWAVHSMEHGAVWISYDPKRVSDPKPLERLAGGGKFVIVAPAAEKQDSPVVASAWGLQLSVDDPKDKRLEAFVDDYERGPQSQEPGATCGPPGQTDTL